MEDRDRAEILAEILRERLPGVQRTIEEWSVPQADPVTYAQLKDLIWQVLGPLGVSMIGFRAAERAAAAGGDVEVLQARALFARVGEDAGRVLERLLTAAGQVRG
ncbi:MAG: hypothetical protein QJR03_10530 [Sphaerobacter sp.]|nr:hypothetical protein [Sphaerobacter sp.]